MRWIIGFVATAVVSTTAGEVFAQSPSHSVLYARNKTWPQPFRAADAQSVIAPFEIMRTNGWREHNTLGSLLFSTEQELSEAGTLKIQWIVTQAPPSHRVIYVKTGATDQITAARVESVEIAVSKLVPTGPLPQILVTDIEPPTSSGSYQTLVHRALIRSTPTPRVPPFGGGINTPAQQTVTPVAQQAVSGGGGGSGGR
ncbi:hypothetical protein SH449x_003937 [Pirellulaceae bacterium SH449]